MSATREAPSRRVLPPPALVSLALAEARRLVFHPAFLAAWVLLLLSYGATDWQHRDGVAVLTNSSWSLQLPAILPVAGAFIGAGLLASRDLRFGLIEQIGVCVVPRWRQRLAQVVAAGSAAVVTAVAVVAHLVIMRQRPIVVGSVLWWEVAAVPAAVLLSCLVAIALVEATRSTAVLLVGAVVLLLLSGAAVISAGRAWTWLSPFAAENPFLTAPLPSDLVSRPAAAHAGWLLALAVSAAAFTLLRAGAPRRPLLLVTAAAVTAATVAAAVQVHSVSQGPGRKWEAANQAPASGQTCRTLGDVIYCVFPGFEGYIPAWHGVVSSQLALVPSQARAVLALRQHLPLATDSQGFGRPLPLADWDRDDEEHGTPNALPVSTRWAAGGEGEYDETAVLDLSFVVAARLVLGRRPPLDEAQGALCGGPGIVTAWLASGATPGTRAALTTVRAHDSGGALNLTPLNSATSLTLGTREAAVVDALLARDVVSVGRDVRRHWSELTAPGVGVDAAATLVGVQPPPPNPDDVACH